MKYIDLGYGAGIVTEGVAKINLRRKGKKQTTENIEEEMQKLSENAIDSYIPSPYLGKNPSRLNDAYEKLIGGNVLSKISTKNQKPFKMAVSTIVYIVLEEIGFNLKKSPSPFEKHENSPNHNQKVVPNRFIRMIVYSYVYQSILAILMLKPKDYYSIFRQMGMSQDNIPLFFEKKKNRRIAEFWSGFFEEYFKKETNLKTMLSKVKIFKD